MNYWKNYASPPASHTGTGTTSPPTNGTSGPTQSPTVSSRGSSDDDVTKETAFIVGMVIIAVALLFMVGGLLLCFIKPKGEGKYKVPVPLRLRPSLSRSSRSRPRSSGYQQMEEPVMRGWSPARSGYQQMGSQDLRENRWSPARSAYKQMGSLELQENRWSPPRSGYKQMGSQDLHENGWSQGYQQMVEPEPVTGSWSPGDPSWVSGWESGSYHGVM